MGYGLGILLLAAGLILALAVDAEISGVDIQLVGWILAALGAVVVVLTAVTLNSRRRTVATTTHADGSQTVHEQSQTPPPAY